MGRGMIADLPYRRKSVKPQYIAFHQNHPIPVIIFAS